MKNDRFTGKIIFLLKNISFYLNSLGRNPNLPET